MQRVGLDTASLDSHLQRHYGIRGDIQPILTGRASNYFISSGRDRWLLKVFQSDYSVSRIQQAGQFLHFLVRRGYPTREFVRSRSEDLVTSLAGRASVLIPWVEGATPEPNTLSDLGQLRDMGALCGRLHRLGGEFPQATELEFAGLNLPVNQAIAQLSNLIGDERSDPDIEHEACVRCAILKEIGEELERSRQAASRGIIHGDFYCAHVVQRNGRPVAVIDVLGERYFPGWELMRAFFRSVSPIEKLRDGTLETLWACYLDGYLSECTIDSREIAVAYDVYLLQLTASTYGLRPPLDNALRFFGRWRTDLARRLASQRDQLRPKMASFCVS
jgi:Ser/Thr protein kinase RdoA (MazF antagonist)